MSKFDVVLKIQAKHGKLYNYKTENGLTIKQMCSLIGISKCSLAKMLCFQWWPSKRTTETVRKLESFFHCPIEDIFPPEVGDRLKKDKRMREVLQKTSTIQKEVDIECLPFSEVAPELEYTPDLDRFEFLNHVTEMLERLSPREQKVIKMRFGLDGEDEATLGECGEALGVSRERIRQMQAKALNRMRRCGIRRSNLKDFL